MAAPSPALLQRLREAWFSWRPLDAALKAALGSELDSLDEEAAYKAQEVIVDALLDSDFAQRHPIHPEPRQKFLSALILLLEGDSCAREVHERLYEAKMVPAAGSEAPPLPQKSYFRQGVHLCSLVESRELVSKGTTGLRTWEAATALVDHLAAGGQHFSSAVELGAGLGYVGIGLVKLGLLDTVVMTDCHPDVLNSLSENCRVNFDDFSSGSSCVSVHRWDWTEPSSMPDLSGVEVALAADVVFDPSIIAPLVTSLSAALADGVRKAVVACTLRNPDTLDKFRSALHSARLEVEELGAAVQGAEVIVFNICQMME